MIVDEDVDILSTEKQEEPEYHRCTSYLPYADTERAIDQGRDQLWLNASKNPRLLARTGGEKNKFDDLYPCPNTHPCQDRRTKKKQGCHNSTSPNPPKEAASPRVSVDEKSNHPCSLSAPRTSIAIPIIIPHVAKVQNPTPAHCQGGEMAPHYTLL
jgi:hypothetical protein